MKGLAALALLVACAASAAPREVDEVVRERLLDSPSPVCIAVGVIRDKQAQAVFACSPGAGPVAFDADSIFEIGSVTKALTGLLLADMVARGEVRIDDLASKYSRPGAKLPTRGGREITLRDLVTHTAGLPRNPFERRGDSNPYGYIGDDELYAELARTELERDIGTQRAYSNVGFMWLSDLLARRAGKSYEALLKERIFVPLGMTSSGVRLTPEQEKRFVKGHDGAYGVVAPWTIGGNLQGVGLVRSSLNDMMKLAAALTIAPDVGDAWNVQRVGSNRIYDHGGGTGGFVAHVAFDRERRVAAVVLADAQASIFDLALHLVDPSYDLRRPFVVVPLDAATRKQYVGTYVGDSGSRLKVWEDGGRLIAQAEGLPTVELMYQGRETFFASGVDLLLTFNRDGAAMYLGDRRSAWRRTKD